MPIAYIGAGNSVESTDDFTPLYPGGYTAVAGDLALVHMGEVVADTDEYLVPAGWEKVGTRLNEMGGTDGRLTVYGKILTASEALPTFTGDTVDIAFAFAEILRGVDPDTPFDVASTESEDNSVTTFTPANITPVTDGAVVVSSCAALKNGGTIDITTPRSFTLGKQDGTTSGANMSVGSAYRAVATAGVVEAPTWERTQFTGFGQWAGVTLALRPAPTAPTSQRYAGVLNTVGTIPTPVGGLGRTSLGHGPLGH